MCVYFLCDLLHIGRSSRSGGAGGRVAVFISKPFDFRGTITAVGGDGSSPGGPGTCYVEIRDGVAIKRMLWIDGANRGDREHLRILLDENGAEDYSFDRIHLSKQARISVKEVSEQEFSSI